MTLVQRSLHWLLIHQRIQYKLCILMYGAAHGYAPDYIINLVTLTPATSGWSHLRSADRVTFDIPWTRTRMGDRALSDGTPFLLTFIVHSAWTLLRSVSNPICLLLLTSYNKLFLSLVTVYCCVFYVLLLFVQCWPHLFVSISYID